VPLLGLEPGGLGIENNLSHPPFSL
jgi:hypothetical protein